LLSARTNNPSQNAIATIAPAARRTTLLAYVFAMFLFGI